MTVIRQPARLEEAMARPVLAATEDVALPVARAADPDAVCWCCGGVTTKRHCKIICTNCGFMRDCSDQ